MGRNLSPRADPAAFGAIVTRMGERRRRQDPAGGRGATIPHRRGRAGAMPPLPLVHPGSAERTDHGGAALVPVTIPWRAWRRPPASESLRMSLKAKPPHRQDQRTDVPVLLVMKDLIPPSGVAALLAAVTLLGATEALGAHPFWAVKTGVSGAVGGAAAFAALRFAGLAPGATAGLGLAALAASGLAAHLGKAAFVASDAENALAGRVWFLGWFSVAGAACLALSGAV